jgi:hypothetical protein
MAFGEAEALVRRMTPRLESLGYVWRLGTARRTPQVETCGMGTTRRPLSRRGKGIAMGDGRGVGVADEVEVRTPRRRR